VTDIHGSFWDFSLRIYALPGVAAKCTVLQDTYGADVNILLWSLWLESEQKRLTEENLQAALKLVSPWAIATVIPLRNIRRQLKDLYGITNPSIETLRQTVKNAELQAERQQQSMLEALAIDLIQAVTPLERGENLQLYLNALSIPLHERELIVTLLKGAS
jgi:uncharacterized protein (TIGR02444 family)